MFQDKYTECSLIGVIFSTCDPAVVAFTAPVLECVTSLAWVLQTLKVIKFPALHSFTKNLQALALHMIEHVSQSIQNHFYLVSMQNNNNNITGDVLTLF